MRETWRDVMEFIILVLEALEPRASLGGINLQKRLAGAMEGLVKMGIRGGQLFV